MPLGSAILMLKHRRKRAVYFTYTTNARGRAAVLVSMIRHRKEAEESQKEWDRYERSRNGPKPKSKRMTTIADLPEGGVEDFQLYALEEGLKARDGDAKVAAYEKKAEKEGFKLFGKTRSAIPKVLLDGKRMSIVEAMKRTGVNAGYQAIYRRLLRGWDAKEAFGLVPRG
jgi:hypothetical protein